MRFGLVGTGPWARLAHGPGLLKADDVELVGVWGRSPDRAGALADELGTAAYADYEALLDDVEAVAFSVPPAVQGELALVAARAGRHLLLDKPVAVASEDAWALVDAVRAAHVASVVFFTDQFAPAVREWHEQVRSQGGWRGGWLRWLAVLDDPDNPFRDSPWRHRSGALWDIGPHALSTLTLALGPVSSLTAAGGIDDTVVLTMRHEGGATSTATLSLFAPPAAAVHDTTVWGEGGLSTMPSRVDGHDSQCLAVAAEELVAAAGSGRRHPLDVAFGARITGLLAQAQTALDGQVAPGGRDGRGA